ncbi:type II toxin-antitoxin system RelE/ParE family toxin [Fundidesulfovibrio agrisoli]|uniref:type II toxin-antitoxin system RelE/ParE family toxin n=1 Tax=Fundidesulfovibrio agrisoli TaxID=2922717 RepID=UPI001FAB583B|nr:type II toxin-antitoxin system RelE/ParE family toxin [Fundidesulfovibrio agrisoli]
MFELRDYVTPEGVDLVRAWLASLRDAKARARIHLRLNRLAGGNFGDCKPLREGVWELRVDVGPGYRVYYSQYGKTVILLLCGGDKRKQDGDIARATACLKDFKERVE